MMKRNPSPKLHSVARATSFMLLLLITSSAARGQASPSAGSSDSLALYEALEKFDLSGGTAQVENVVLKRDRAEITFSGTFYLEPLLRGQVRGMVFIGTGKVHADVPDTTFEKANLHRMLHADAIDADFKTAVLRFSDDTTDAMGLKVTPGGDIPDAARKLASEFAPRTLRAAGANIPARVAASILNNEAPGFFLAEFDKGSRGRFDLMLDYQGRLPMAHFGLDGGEKGLFYAYDEAEYRPDVWMAFFSLADYKNRVVEYSDVHALVRISRYDMDIDVRDWKHMKLQVRMQMTSVVDGVLAIPLMINEELSAYDSERLKKAMRLKGARLASGDPLTAVQEDWDGSVTLLLPVSLAKGQEIAPVLDFEGSFLFGDEAGLVDAHYVREDCWYPRHVNLNRATFDMTFHHKKGTRVAAIGSKVREEETADHSMVTEWRMDQPVDLATFAVGNFDVYTDKVKTETGGELNLDFYRIHQINDSYASNVKTDFMLAEMGNCVRYFSALFGPYPYQRFGATFHPFAFGQGFPTMLMLPKSDRADKYTYSFIAHETSHQWWGDTVLWRSYRDQWLSEGFADYSGVLYTGLRDKDKNSPRDLLRDMHDELLEPPHTQTGIGKGRLVDIGPIILGHRLDTRESYGSYEALIYKKGALVLRMLHFLFSDPSTGQDKAFFDMMKDFVNRYANKSASTEDFVAVANEHFASSPLAQAHQMKDLNWFFRQWVYDSALPSYEFSYWIDPQPDGSAVIHGLVLQSDAPEQWGMPLPLVLHFGKDKFARGIVFAVGAERPVTLHVAAVPDSIELDPDRWILSNKTTTVKTSSKK